MGTTATKPTDAGPGRRTGLERADVVAAALDLVVREGPDALTMRRLATELDVGAPTIYWHVGSRDELVAAVVRAQAERLAGRPVAGTTPRERVASAALHIYAGAIENRPITSLAHQTGTTSLLLHPLEAALVAELEAAGLAGPACADAARAILVVVTGALVLALRDPSRFPEAYRPDVLWAGAEAPIAPATRAALCAEPDIDALTAATVRAVVAHHVPEEAQ
ncbi:MAG TPA: helix-turn-helix domain-containing protein [Acidimicrobiales bacterium]|nr:helix-turn-helix domain-containing protein [Acidimicrobiales bacterium]